MQANINSVMRMKIKMENNKINWTRGEMTNEN